MQQDYSTCNTNTKICKQLSCPRYRQGLSNCMGFSALFFSLLMCLCCPACFPFSEHVLLPLVVPSILHCCISGVVPSTLYVQGNTPEMQKWNIKVTTRGNKTHAENNPKQYRYTSNKKNAEKPHDAASTCCPSQIGSMAHREQKHHTSFLRCFPNLKWPQGVLFASLLKPTHTPSIHVQPPTG